MRTNEEDLIDVLLTGIADELVLFECQGERFLAKDVLTRFEHLNGNLHVPMVGRDDADYIDVIALKNLAIILVRVGFAFANRSLFFARSAWRASTSQTADYIDFQIKQAGGDAKIFSPEVKELLHDFTGGLPRAINNLAIACLLQAAARNVVRVDEDIFHQAAGEFQLQ